jgi:hypothetical protein
MQTLDLIQQSRLIDRVRTEIARTAYSGITHLVVQFERGELQISASAESFYARQLLIAGCQTACAGVPAITVKFDIVVNSADFAKS